MSKIATATILIQIIKIFHELFPGLVLLVFLLNESVQLDQLQCCRCIEFMCSPFPTSSTSRKARGKAATITFVSVKTRPLNIIALSQSKNIFTINSYVAFRQLFANR